MRVMGRRAACSETVEEGMTAPGEAEGARRATAASPGASAVGPLGPLSLPIELRKLDGTRRRKSAGALAS